MRTTGNRRFNSVKNFSKLVVLALWITLIDPNIIQSNQNKVKDILDNWKEIGIAKQESEKSLKDKIISLFTWEK